MKHLNESEIPFSTGGKFGSKYLHRCSNYEFGNIVIPPQTRYAEKSHIHKKTTEVFWFTQGAPLLLVDDKKIRIKQGEVYVVEPTEVHNFMNDTDNPVHITFIKSPGLLEDRIEVEEEIK